MVGFLSQLLHYRATPFAAVSAPIWADHVQSHSIPYGQSGNVSLSSTAPNYNLIKDFDPSGANIDSRHMQHASE